MAGRARPHKEAARELVLAWLGTDYKLDRDGGLHPDAADALVERITTATTRARDAGRALRNYHARRETASSAETSAPKTRGKHCRDAPAATIAAIHCWAAGCEEPPASRCRGLCKAHHQELVAGGAEVERSWRARKPTATQPPGSPLPMLERLEVDDVPAHRQTACPAYNACEDWTVTQRWPGFSCKGCLGPAATTTTNHQGAA